MNLGEVSSDILTVDPGVGGTGLAYWPSLVGAAIAPAWTEILKPNDPRAEWLDRSACVAEQFGAQVGREVPALVVIEDVRVYHTTKSLSAAENGDLIKLAELVGMLVFCARCDYGCEVRLVAPADWKGQMGAGAVGRRIHRAIGEKYKEHVREAVGLGLAVGGWL